MGDAVGYGAVLLAIIAVVKTLLTDRTLKSLLTAAEDRHEKERNEWQAILTSERERWDKDIIGMSARLASMEQELASEHTRKHDLRVNLASALGMVSTMIVLAENCTCGVFDRVQFLIDKYKDDMTIPPSRPI